MDLRWVRWGIGLGLAIAASASQALVFAVNEGVTYRVAAEEVAAKYAGIAADLSKVLKQPVTIEPVGDYPTLRRGLAAKTYDLALVHPAHVSIVAMKASGYRLVCITKGYDKYTASFLVKGDSAMKAMGDLKGTTIGAPDEDSITAWMARATLRDAIGDPRLAKWSYTRFQDAVPFFVENNLTGSGATASASVVKAWQAKGGRVLGASRAVPVKHVIASPSLPSADYDKVRHYLLTLDSTEEGRKRLEPTKYIGFMPYEQTDMLAIGTWLGL